MYIHIYIYVYIYRDMYIINVCILCTWYTSRVYVVHWIHVYVPIYVQFRLQALTLPSA